MPSLVPVDDRKIRKKAFAQLERLLRRLQRLESHVEAFFERDERLFKDWYELTFRDDKRALSDLRAEYRLLADFHNWMIALSHMEGLSLPEAIWRLREEERLYRAGTAEQRRRIEEARALRDQFIASESERKSRRTQRRQAAAGASVSESASRPSPDLSDLEELSRIGELSDMELEEWCASPEVAFSLLGMTLRGASLTEDLSLFFRLWDLTHVKIQRDFARDFEREQGCSLFDVIEAMRETAGEAPSRERDDEADQVRALASESESIKLVFRQLARKLHPDMNAADEGSEWRKKMWLRVQDAYKQRDLRALNKLFHLALLRGRELADLRVSELHLSEAWLGDELKEQAEYVRNLRRNPAWGFSRRKDFAAIKRRLSRDVVKARRKLEADVVELRTHHAFLERLGRDVAGG